MGLSPAGWGLFTHLLGQQRLGESPVPVLEPAWLSPRCCALGLFDGIGGLRRSLERLRCHVVFSVSVESDARARRVVRNAYPGTHELLDVCKVTHAWLGWLIQSCLELKIVLLVLGAGFPCQDVSLLHKGRAGATGARTGLFTEWVRIAHTTQRLCRDAGICFIGFGECTLMARADEARISAAIQWPKLELCASGASTSRRPRNYWTNNIVSDCEGLTVAATPSGYKGRLHGPCEPNEFWILPNWQWPGGEVPGARLPTFTRAICRRRPPPGAPGLEVGTAHALERYRRDHFRFPPYTFADTHCLWPSALGTDWASHPELGRVACAAEREMLLGFLPGHTRATHKGHNEGLKGAENFAEECVRCSLLGNSFHTLSVSMFLGSLLRDASFVHLCVSPRILHERFIAECAEYERTGGDRIVDELISLEEMVVDKGPVPNDAVGDDVCEVDELLLMDWPRLFPDNEAPDQPGPEHLRCAEKWLVEAHIRSCDQRGAEVRTDLKVPWVARPQVRSSVDTRRWRWRHVLKHKVKQDEHINKLELRAFELALRWRLRARARSRRFLHLVDSQVVLSVLGRGRTSSRKLRPVLRSIFARALSAGVFFAIGFVQSGLNVADIPSRTA